MFQNDMRFTNYMNKITSSVTGSLGFLRRNLNIDSPQQKTTAYKALVRLLLEYACTVWDPYTQMPNQESPKTISALHTKPPQEKV